MKMKKWIPAFAGMTAILLFAAIALGAALTKDRSTPARTGQLVNLPVAAANTIWVGSMAAVDSSGYIVPASDDTSLTVLGRAEAQADNSDGAAGDLSIDIGTGIFRYANHAGVGNIASDDDIGKLCYAVDDQTVSLSSNGATRPIAGTIYDVDSSGVWVDFRRAERSSPAQRVAVCNTTTAETDADASVVETNASISATDIIVAFVYNGTGALSIINAVPAAGSATFSLSANGGAGTKINYCAIKDAL
jgi:hypothetical protein